MYIVVLSCALKPGDLVAFSGDSLISDIINIGTYGLPRWGASHVGIIANYKGKLLLFESTTLEGIPCEITGKEISGVQAHDLATIVERYKGRIWLYPLCRPLFDFESDRLSQFLVSKIGTPYSEMAAFRSGGIGLSYFEACLRPEDLHVIFCSELVSAAYREIGLMRTDNVARWSPNFLTRSLRRQSVVLKPNRLK